MKMLAGPAISFFTSCCDLKQKEQYVVLGITHLSVRVILTVRYTLTRGEVKTFLAPGCGLAGLLRSITRADTPRCAGRRRWGATCNRLALGEGGIAAPAAE
jgi:hypothetical protein